MSYTTFTEVADASFESSINYNTLITSTEYGKERRRNKWTNPRRTFVLYFNNATQEVMEYIRDFHLNVGNFETFSWENPNDNQTYTVRFLEDNITINYLGYDVYEIQLNFIEVL
jgi:phage-related protein